jgi:hypothetical protein
MSDQEPSNEASDPTRYNFSAHAIGASAQFHKLDAEDLASVIQVPTLGASVLPAIGGVSVSEVSNFCHETFFPRRRNLVTVHRIRTKATGLVHGKQYRTEAEADVESITFVDKFHIESAKYHLLSVRDAIDAPPKVSTANRLTGIHLGLATLEVELDDYLLPSFATETQIEANLKAFPGGGKTESYGAYRFHLVKNLVINQGLEKNGIEKIAHNAVHWKDFGSIFFGEVIVKGDDRQVTLVRLQMGSDAGGSGTVGDGHSNGSAGSN